MLYIGYEQATSRICCFIKDAVLPVENEYHSTALDGVTATTTVRFHRAGTRVPDRKEKEEAPRPLASTHQEIFQAVTLIQLITYGLDHPREQFLSGAAPTTSYSKTNSKICFEKET